jgi:hypothetical protein
MIPLSLILSKRFRSGKKCQTNTLRLSKDKTKLSGPNMYFTVGTRLIILQQYALLSFIRFFTEGVQII